MEIPCVRFDDLSVGGSGSFGLLEPQETFTARRLDDVVSVLQQAEAAAIAGSWVAGYVSYEAAPAVNPVLTVRPAGLHDRMRDLPLARFQTFGRRIPLDEIDSVHFPAGDYNVSGWTADSTPEDYRGQLAAMGRAIMAGEVSQLKHTFRLHAAFSGDPAALYRDLLLSQRGPHAACLDVDRFRIVSASPQSFFRLEGDRLTVRPVLATTRRGRWLDEDRRTAAELLAAGEASYTNRLIVKEIETELAELGEVRGVAAPERYGMERLETVWQLTAELGARVNPDIRVVDVFAALFPLASLTGVPKVEAMALLAATEESARGAYCGTIGFLGPAQEGGVDASFNVAVRTVVVDEDEGVAEFGVGASITNGSEVVAAFDEARLKAKVLVDRRPDFQLVATIRFAGGEACDAGAQFARLTDSANYFGYVVDEARLREELAAVTAGLSGDRIVTIRLDRDGSIETDLRPAPRWQDGPGAPELLLGVISERVVSTENVYLFHSTTDRRVADALARDHPDVDVVVVCNQRKEVAGAVGANVVACIGGVWVTPPFECGTVPSVFRDRLVANGTVEERLLSCAELRNADEVAVVNDLAGWRTVELLG
jgi:para-aminobenzoate synthetase/4-amino-4-deoxychorismate lyase